MLKKKCIDFIKKTRDADGPQKEEIDEEYQALSLTISQSKNIEELVDVLEELYEFDILRKVPAEEETIQYTKTHYNFFSQNQKNFLSFGLSVGLVKGLVELFECCLQGYFSWDNGLNDVLYSSVYGSAIGYLVASFIDHVQSFVEGDFRVDIYVGLLTNIMQRTTALNKELNKDDFLTRPFLLL